MNLYLLAFLTHAAACVVGMAYWAFFGGKR